MVRGQPASVAVPTPSNFRSRFFSPLLSFTIIKRVNKDLDISRLVANSSPSSEPADLLLFGENTECVIPPRETDAFLLVNLPVLALMDCRA